MSEMSGGYMLDPATLQELLRAHAKRAPDAPLLIAPDNVHEPGLTLSYGELENQARLLAGELRARGGRRGDRVALFLQNGIRTTTIFLGAIAAGYTVAPLNLLSQRGQLAYVLDHCDCKVLFTSQTYANQVNEALRLVSRSIKVIEVDEDALFQGSAPEHDAVWEPVAPHDPALLMYTSGTTGKPKGVLLTHRNLLAAAESVARWHGLGTADRVLSSLPLYHINGQVISTVTPFVSGGSIVAPHRFSVSTWWDYVDRYECTWINMVPTIIAYLLNAAEPTRSYHFPTLRFGRSASAPLPPEQHLGFERTFGIPVIEAMGMTESASVAFCNPMDSRKRQYGSPGLPCGVEAYVADPDGGPVPNGTVGEIRFRGENVMSGYYKDPERTAESLTRERWLCTGDLGYRNADGFYFITGRIKELIIKGGENIAPREIDEALLKHAGVLEAAAVGIPDPNYGQEIAAAVVLKAGAACTEEDLRQYCQDELGRYKTPKIIRIVDDLPKGPSGKVQRLSLAGMLATR
jgi:acyl-CoA synthetase (AMP-forming)/AMP-acid ligase II